MALEHCFSIIKNKEKIEKVNIPDDFINYIKDSLFWIVSSWNGKTLKSGLPYYGEALISDDELVKFKTILGAVLPMANALYCSNLSLLLSFNIQFS